MLTGLGVAGTWLVVTGLPNWPDWSLFPGAILGVLCMLAMMLGLGIVVVSALEPVIGLMDLNWDAEPIAVMGLPYALQRNCERLGYWTAEDLSRAVERGSFPWTKIAYDERMQIERAAQLWKARSQARAAQRERKAPATRLGDGRSADD